MEALLSPQVVWWRSIVAWKGDPVRFMKPLGPFLELAEQINRFSFTKTRPREILSAACVYARSLNDRVRAHNARGVLRHLPNQLISESYFYPLFNVTALAIIPGLYYTIPSSIKLPALGRLISHAFPAVVFLARDRNRSRMEKSSRWTESD